MEIDQYMTMPGTHTPTAPRSEWGNIVPQTPINILFRKTKKLKIQRSKSTGELTEVSVTEYLTKQVVAIGDLLDDDEIYAMEELIDFDGSYIGCICYPRPPLGFTP